MRSSTGLVASAAARLMVASARAGTMTPSRDRSPKPPFAVARARRWPSVATNATSWALPCRNTPFRLARVGSSETAYAERSTSRASVSPGSVTFVSPFSSGGTGYSSLFCTGKRDQPRPSP
jgi:hypothetical protein